MGFSRQEYSSGLPLSSPGDLPDPVIEPMSLALAGGFLTTELLGKPESPCRWYLNKWVWLFANKTLLSLLKYELLIICMSHRVLWFFFQPFRHVKPFSDRGPYKSRWQAGCGPSLGSGLQRQAVDPKPLKAGGTDFFFCSESPASFPCRNQQNAVWQIRILHVSTS